MSFDGAVIREQGVVFAIVTVKNHILNSQAQAAKAQDSFQPFFPGMPVVLMGQDTRGVPRYFGRPDIVRFLSRIDPSRIPWKRYSAA